MPVKMRLGKYKWVIMSQVHVIILLCAIITLNTKHVSGEETDLTSYSESELEEVHHSHVKLRTCCSLDLNLPENDCANRKDKWGQGNNSLKEYKFSRHIMAENVSTVFPIESSKLACKPGPPKKVHIPNWPGGDGSQKLLRNGYLKVDSDYYPPAEFCINAKNETIIELHTCPQTCIGSRPCIRKCCSLDKVYSFGVQKAMSKGCQSHKGDYFNPIFYDTYKTKSTHHILDPHFVEHYPTKTFKKFCPLNKTVFYLFPEASEILNNAFGTKFHGLGYRIREDGKILYKHPKDGKCSILDPEHVCIDGVINYGKPNLTYVNNEAEMVMFLCPLPSPDNAQVKRVFGLLYGSSMIVSSVFLLMTIATYVALWERQSVHGWTIVSHVVSLFFMYIFLGMAHIIGVTSGHDYLGSNGCIGIGIVTHFFFLSTFCWLFLISVDLWRTFRAFTPRSGQRSKGLSRYIKYSIFGWGIPLIFVIIGLILEDRYPEGECHTLLTPAYGKDSCFPQQKALGVYLYYPIAVMIVLNMIFFAITTSKLYLYRQSTKMATKDDKQTQFYRLFLKLFFIMGVLWVFEVISWAASGNNGYHWFWIVFDMLNILRALAVFIIFVCKRDIIFALEEKYPCLKRRVLKVSAYIFLLLIITIVLFTVLLPFAWIFKRKHSSRDDSSMMTRTSTLRQTVSSDGKPESIGLIVNSNKLNN